MNSLTFWILAYADNLVILAAFWYALQKFPRVSSNLCNRHFG